MSYDKEFIENVKRVIEAHENEMEGYSDDARAWFEEIHNYCEHELRLYFPFMNISNHPFNENTPPGEVVSCMIWQGLYDQELQYELNKRLQELASQRESVVIKPWFPYQIDHPNQYHPDQEQ